uniref:Major capsid protein N-terminal domain-containing protein n=1 Tax=viral metagenome TaxID=1070528 RepID=A0A6C0CAH1_9ZZZZ
MPLGTFQLIFVGAQNIYTTENPEITLFRTVYKRHTNFAIDAVEEFFTSKIGFGQTVRCKLSKNGDLLSKLGLSLKLSNPNRRKPECENICDANPFKNKCSCHRCLLNDPCDDVTYGWVNAIGHVVIDYIELYVGESLVDRHYGEWLEIWTELSQTAEKRLGYYEMIGKKDPLSYTVDSFTGEMDVFIPFSFWFCRNIGLALPVLSLIYHDVDIVIRFRPLEQCWVSNKRNVPCPVVTMEGNLVAEYIYLCSEERRTFYKQSHVYLMEQLQLNENNTSEFNVGRMNIQLDFMHPVKEMIWFVQRKDVVGPPDGVWESDCSYPKGNDHFNFTSSTIPRRYRPAETFIAAKLQLSGVDRTIFWPASYYRLIQNYYYHTRIPTANNIYTYSFCLAPEDHQPTGECNMSMVDNARLCIKLGNRDKCNQYGVRIKIYAINYNVFFITGGMGAPMFYN